MHKLNLIFAGLARDCEQNIVKNVAAIFSLLGQSEVGSLQLLVAENDSKDNTRDILIRLSKTNANLELSLLPPLDDVFPERIRRIAYCRQVLWEAAYAKSSCYPIDKTLYVPVDLDSEIFSSVDLRQFTQSCYSLTLDSKIDAIFPASYPCYYDILALRSSGWCSSDCLNDFKKFQRFKSKFISMLAWNWFVTFRQKSLFSLVKMGPFVSVQSAFGGFGIYRFSSARFAKYFDHDWSSALFGLSNEHVLFNQAISCKVIQTNLVVMAPEEHVVISSQGFFATVNNYLIAIGSDIISVFRKPISRLKSFI